MTGAALMEFPARPCGAKDDATQVSDLMRGKIDLFSIDTLIELISRLGTRVQIAVRGARKAA
jgi:hypothetical protein